MDNTLGASTGNRGATNACARVCRSCSDDRSGAGGGFGLALAGEPRI
jgi:hypothetical protein